MIMAEVHLTETEKQRGMQGFESMLSRFNRLVQDSGVFRELKKREFYEKPSIKRRKKLYESNLKRKKKDVKFQGGRSNV